MEVVSRAIFIQCLFTKSGNGKLVVNDDGSDRLHLTEAFKFDESSSNWLELNCQASTSAPYIFLFIGFPQEIPRSRELEALKLANRINIECGGPCSVILEPSREFEDYCNFRITSNISFVGYFDADDPEGNSPHEQDEAGINLLAAMLGTANALNSEIHSVS